MLFVDFSSAFNTVVPHKLVNKLRNLGLTTKLCSWILDFLTNRPQNVRVGEYISSTLTLNTGVPQCCVLSPALFTLFTHDCTPIYSSNSMVKFANDTVVGLISGNDETHYKEEVQHLVMWCSDDVTDPFLVSCMLHITDINYMAPRYRPGRIITPATKDRFTNNLPDLSQLLCVPINTDELDTITSNMGTIFSNTLETVAPIKLKKVREKRAAPWYNSYTHSLKKETRILERKWRKTNLEVFRIAWKNSMSSYRQALKTARTEYIRKLIITKTIQGFYLAQWLD